jgi:hypothetical protein
LTLGIVIQDDLRKVQELAIQLINQVQDHNHKLAIASEQELVKLSEGNRRRIRTRRRKAVPSTPLRD